MRSFASSNSKFISIGLKYVKAFERSRNSLDSHGNDLVMNGKVLSSTLTLAITCAAFGSDFALHNRDRVVFYGDSITDNSPYTTFVETFVVTRFPNLNVRFFNAGVGGDRVSGGWMGPIDQRLPRDLFSRKPTVVTVMLGMNDGSYRPFDQGIFDTYRKGYQHIVDESKKQIPNARFFLIKPSPYDDVTREGTGYNSVLRQYGEYLAELAQKSGYSVIDMNTPVVDMLTAAKQNNAALASKIIGDRVHPGSAGHLVMAESILKNWGAPSTVSSTTIDAKSGSVQAENAKVSNVKLESTIRWTALEGALPFPLDRKNDQVKLVLRSSDFDQALNQETLKVTNLNPGKYKLSIDGMNVGTFDHATLAIGINLAEYDTPMTGQANTVFAVTSDRTQTRYFMWRQIEFGLAAQSASDVASVMKEYEKAEDSLIRLQHKLAKPVEHKFELSPG